MTKIVQMILGLPAALIGCLTRLVRSVRFNWLSLCRSLRAVECEKASEDIALRYAKYLRRQREARRDELRQCIREEIKGLGVTRNERYNMQNDTENTAPSPLIQSPGSEAKKRKIPAMVYYYDDDGERQCLGRVEVSIEEPGVRVREDVEEYWHQMNERAKEWILKDIEVDIIDALFADDEDDKMDNGE